MRLLKWVGDPIITKDDGWRIYNWKYENRRVVALWGVRERELVKGDHGLSQSYRWHKYLPNFILNVEDGDANIILTNCPYEFADVTNDPAPHKIGPITIKGNDKDRVEQLNNTRIISDMQKVGPSDNRLQESTRKIILPRM